jgi:ubiquinone biosynthesis monooxygenase Coq7
MRTRQYSPIDTFLLNIDTAVRTLSGNVSTTSRDNPANPVVNKQKLTSTEQRLSGSLMRINHAGEVSAQGLYQGQALTAKLPKVRDQMQQAALEENDHLHWCRHRATQLGTHTSYLDPLWYVGSLGIGALAGLAGDKWSLGFVAETERQVVKHLDEHLQKLPVNDKKSQAILEQMKDDESHHATVALKAGAAELPTPIKKVMGLMSKVMTRTTYWL